MHKFLIQVCLALLLGGKKEPSAHMSKKNFPEILSKTAITFLLQMEVHLLCRTAQIISILQICCHSASTRNSKDHC